jgi:phospholipase C
MGHFVREDIPFYHALADAFTIGDQYFCSIHGPTNPNRMFLFSGTSGLSVGDARAQAVDNVDDGNWTADMARDKADFPAVSRWTTYAERLENAGISWKLYQEYENFGDNSLAFFAQFRGIDKASPLYRRGRAWVEGSSLETAATSQAEHLVAAFARDVAADSLPQVSWIVAPYRYSEHPEATPAYGESLTARLVEALVANPAVWAKTALIINYDENDGFFDHIPGPVPAIAREQGSARSTRAARPIRASRWGWAFACRCWWFRPGRAGLRQFAGVRPYLGDPLPRTALRGDGAQYQPLAPRGDRRPDLDVRFCRS